LAGVAHGSIFKLYMTSEGVTTTIVIYLYLEPDDRSRKAIPLPGYTTSYSTCRYSKDGSVFYSYHWAVQNLLSHLSQVSQDCWIPHLFETLVTLVTLLSTR